MSDNPITAAQWREKHTTAAVLTEASSRGWKLANWWLEIELDSDVPFPGSPNGYRVDPRTGLSIGWYDAAAGCFADKYGRDVALLCGWWELSRKRQQTLVGFEDFVQYHRITVGVLRFPQASMLRQGKQF